MNKFKNSGFEKIWLIICIPVISFVLNIILSELQENIGYECFIISTVFLLFLIVMFYYGYQSCTKTLFNDIFLSGFKHELQSFTNRLIDRVECKNVEGIVSEQTLSKMEAKTEAKEIWIATNYLETESQGYGAGYVEIVQNNLDNGIVYRFFYPSSDENNMKAERMKRLHNYHKNLICYEVSDEFYFLVTGVDFTIYNPLFII